MDAERDRQEEARRGTAPWLGLGASHQAGWTGVVARAMHPFATTSPDERLELGKVAALTGLAEPPAGRS